MLVFLYCYDLELPEHVRRLARAGAELILGPTALPQGPFAAFIATSVVPVRAFENQVFVVYADHVGSDGRFAYAGLSRAIGPDGQSLAAAGDNQPALLFADIDPGAYPSSRKANHHLSPTRARTPPPRHRTPPTLPTTQCPTAQGNPHPRPPSTP